MSNNPLYPNPNLPPVVGIPAGPPPGPPIQNNPNPNPDPNVPPVPIAGPPTPPPVPPGAVMPPVDHPPGHGPVPPSHTPSPPGHTPGPNPPPHSTALPKQGDVVLYVMPDGITLRPAIVVVAHAGQSMCNMQVFTDGDHDKVLLGDDEAQDVIWRAGVPFAPPLSGQGGPNTGHHKNSWHWPAK